MVEGHCGEALALSDPVTAMEIPKNCLECKHKENCRSYYGGSMCKHIESIQKMRGAMQHEEDSD